jgi:PAS domain S-box-containing protein
MKKITNPVLMQSMDSAQKRQRALNASPKKVQQNRIRELLEINERLQAEILKRKSNEDALEHERKRLYAVLDELPACVHLVAPDHSIRFSNRYFRKQFGDCKAKPCHQILYNNQKPCKVCHTFDVFRTKDPGEYEGLRSNGKLYKIYNYPFKDLDSTELVLQLGVEITEQKKAEEALRKSEQRFRSLVNSMDDTVFTLDGKQRFAEIYGTLFERIGISAEQSIGKKIDDILSNGKSKIHSKALSNAYQGENVLYEWSTERPDGVKYIQNSLSPILNLDGTAEGLVGVARDISSRKLNEKQMIQTEKLMAISQMSAMISHEFRNSLTSVRMILELQLESENLNKSEIKSLSVALSSVHHMEKIVTQLLNFSRPATLKFQKGNLNSVVEESIAFINAHLIKNQITLKQSLEPVFPAIKLDPRYVKEALINLFLNAIQAFKNKDLANIIQREISIKTKKYILKNNLGDGHVSATTTAMRNADSWQQKSDIFLTEGTTCAVIEIKDNGIGIKRAIQTHIFDPFYTISEGGTGLGLPMVKRTVNAHGGIITVNSVPGRGSTFTIYFPIENNKNL